ncbi:MAG: glycoside hydrolase family 2 protein [Verrucomicrobiota bacterium]
MPRKRHLHLTLIALLSATATLPAAPPLVNVPGRVTHTLDGRWHTIIDPYENGYYNYRWQPHDEQPGGGWGYYKDPVERKKTDLIEYDFDTSPTLVVPGDWNSQDDKLFYYEGTIWYRKRMPFTPTLEDGRVFLHFGAANYEAHVYLNGEKLGSHVGGFTPFWFEITDKLAEGENSFVVKVDNRRVPEGVPTENTDWWNFGGLTREVQLVEVPATYLADYTLAVPSAEEDRLTFSLQLEGEDAAQTVTLRILELDVETTVQTDADGRASGTLDLPGLQRWSPEDPKLYTVELAAETDTVTERIGFRTIETAGTDILLNGEPVFLRGISLHEENPLRGGRAWSREDAEMLLGWVRELGCNFVRLAHYPHNDHMARVADEMGLMVWAEVPVYWTIHWENPETLANARNQLRELIERDRNRASVVVWSVANETPVSEPRTRFLKTLVEDARALDGTRLVSAAMEVHREADRPLARIVNDPFGEYTDLISFNQYVGWYDGLPERCDEIEFEVHYDKPVVVSEFGAGALQGYHADALTRFSEEFQEDLYRRTLPMLEKIPQWRGVTPWILVDFHSPRRPLPHIQDGWNRKGLLGETGAKKLAWHVLHDFYARKAREGNDER